MWSALQLTILVNVDKDLAVGDKVLDDERLLNPEIAEDKVEVDTSDAETATFNGENHRLLDGGGGKDIGIGAETEVAEKKDGE